MAVQAQEMAASAASSVIGATAKAAPPVAVAGMTICGVHLNDLVLWVTLIYTVTQFVFLISDRLKRHRHGRGGRR